MLLELKRILYNGILGRLANMEIATVWQNVATMQGATPYIMAIAMMYASPIPIVALAEGKKSRNGTVASVTAVRIIQ
jgi:hypothetical protein